MTQTLFQKLMMAREAIDEALNAAFDYRRPNTVTLRKGLEALPSEAKSEDEIITGMRVDASLDDFSVIDLKKVMRHLRNANVLLVDEGE